MGSQNQISPSTHLPRGSPFILHSFHKHFQSTLSMPGPEELSRQEEGGAGTGHTSGRPVPSPRFSGPSSATFQLCDLGREFYSLMTQFPPLYTGDDEQVIIWEGGSDT